MYVVEFPPDLGKIPSKIHVGLLYHALLASRRSDLLVYYLISQQEEEKRQQMQVVVVCFSKRIEGPNTSTQYSQSPSLKPDKQPPSHHYLFPCFPHPRPIPGALPARLMGLMGRDTHDSQRQNLTHQRCLTQEARTGVLNAVRKTPP